MAPPKKIEGQVTIIGVRAPAEVVRIATAIASLRQETLSDVLRKALREYVSAYQGEASKKLAVDEKKK